MLLIYDSKYVEGNEKETARRNMLIMMKCFFNDLSAESQNVSNRFLWDHVHVICDIASSSSTIVPHNVSNRIFLRLWWKIGGGYRHCITNNMNINQKMWKKKEKEMCMFLKLQLVNTVACYRLWNDINNVSCISVSCLSGTKSPNRSGSSSQMKNTDRGI